MLLYSSLSLSLSVFAHSITLHYVLARSVQNLIRVHYGRHGWALRLGPSWPFFLLVSFSGLFLPGHSANDGVIEWESCNCGCWAHSRKPTQVWKQWQTVVAVAPMSTRKAGNRRHARSPLRRGKNQKQHRDSSPLWSWCVSSLLETFKQHHTAAATAAQKSQCCGFWQNGGNKGKREWWVCNKNKKKGIEKKKIRIEKGSTGDGCSKKGGRQQPEVDGCFCSVVVWFGVSFLLTNSPKVCTLSSRIIII